MKNKKGFTLVEVLAVVVILSIIGSIAMIAVNNVRRKQEIKNRQNVIMGVLTASKKYTADNPSVLNDLANNSIPVYTLIEQNYTEFDMEKYSDIADENSKVKFESCVTNNVRIKYYIELNDENGNLKKYTDCGCDPQTKTGNFNGFCIE